MITTTVTKTTYNDENATGNNSYTYDYNNDSDTYDRYNDITIMTVMI